MLKDESDLILTTKKMHFYFYFPKLNPQVDAKAEKSNAKVQSESNKMEASL